MQLLVIMRLPTRFAEALAFPIKHLNKIVVINETYLFV